MLVAMQHLGSRSAKCYLLSDLIHTNEIKYDGGRGGRVSLIPDISTVRKRRLFVVILK